MEAEVYKAGDKFSPASLVKLTFHCPASATGEVQKSTHCMKVPVKPEEGSQNVSVCSATHISTQGCSSRPFQRCHCPGLAPCLHLPALRGQERGRAQLCPRPHCHRSLPCPSEQQPALTLQPVLTLLASPNPFPKLCTSFFGVSSCFDAASNLENTRTASNPVSSLEKGATTVLRVPQALSFPHTYVRAGRLCWY